MVKMKQVKRDIDGIKDTIPEINSLRSEFTTMKNSIAGKVNGRREVLKSEGDRIICDISDKVDHLIGKINDTVKLVKDKKKNATGTLYDKFLSYLGELETAGLMQNGKFSLMDTVTYQKLIDKDNFIEPLEETRDEANPNKEHIEFGDGIENFFNSIGRAWKTRKEPKTIKNTYIDIEKYISENVDPIQAAIATYVDKLKGDYKSDIDNLKTETKKRIDSVIMLIEEKDAEIATIRNEAYEIAADEKQYDIQIKKLESERTYLDQLISKLSYMQI